MHHVFTGPSEAKRGLRATGTGVTEDCEPSCGLWESNLDLLSSLPCSSISPSPNQVNIYQMAT